MRTLKISKVSESAVVPQYATKGAAGMDLYASENAVICAGGVGLVKTGLKIELPKGTEGQVRSRSGLALKKGIFILNSPGTIDEDYRGELGIILANFGKEDFVINVGDRVAQLIIASTYKCKIKETAQGKLSKTQRGEGGFGSTGVNKN